AMRRRSGDVASVEQNAPAGRRHESGDDVEQRGLAGAVGADQGGDGALFDPKGAFVDGDDAAEAFADPVDDDQVRPARARSPFRAPGRGPRRAQCSTGSDIEAGPRRASPQRKRAARPGSRAPFGDWGGQLSFWMYWPLSHSYMT